MSHQDEEQAVEDIQLSDKAEKQLDHITRDWIDTFNQRTRDYRHLNDVSLEEYWDGQRDSVDAHVDPPTDPLEEWRSQAYRPKTRNKTFAASAVLVASGVGVDFTAQNLERSIDREMSKFADDLYSYTLEQEHFDFKEAIAVHEQSVTGTVHIFDEIVWDKRMVKEITDIDFETDDITYELKERVDFKGCRSEIVPNEECYPGDIWEPDVQKQPYFIRRRITTYESARSAFDKYANWKHVQKGSHNFLPTTEDEKEEIRESDDDKIEIVWYWNKPSDEYQIIINGVPMKKHDAGFPYPHKNYPMAKGVNTFFSDFRFYFGQGVPNLNRDEQTTTNDLWRVMIDSVKLAAEPPVAVSSPDLLDSDIMVPRAVVPKGPDDVIEPLRTVAAGLSNDIFQVMQMNEIQTDENTIDSIPAGKQPQGDPTATEIRAVVGASERLRGFAEILLGDLLIQHARLRLPNALWFFTHDEEYQQIVIDNVKVNVGGTGKRKIIFADAVDIPSEQDILKAEVEAADRGEPTDFIVVDKDGVMDYRFHIAISAVPKPRRTASTRLLRALEKFRVYSQAGMDPDRNRRDLAEAFGDDPDEYVPKAPPAPEAPLQPQGQLPGATQATNQALNESPIGV